MAEDKDIDVKDLSSTSFGYIIAFLLPGLMALIGMGQFISTQFVAAGFLLHPEASIGPSLLYAAAALALGMIVSGARFVLFEKWLCRKHSFPSDMFEQLVDSGNLSYFKSVVDEHYRYHQFFGGAFIALIPSLILLHIKLWSSWGWGVRIGVMSLSIAIECLIAYCAFNTFERYVFRGSVVVKKKSPIVGK